jgi:hypothetical protein
MSDFTTYADVAADAFLRIDRAETDARILAALSASTAASVALRALALLFPVYERREN